MTLFEKAEIVRNREVLRESYIPKGEEILYREEQIKKLAAYLSCVLDKTTPSHILILGPRGTGKTAIVKYVVSCLDREIEKDNTLSVNIGYTIRPGTACMCLSLLGKDIGISLPMRGSSFTDLLNRYEDNAKGKISIFIVDELDSLPENDLSTLTYFLSRTGKFCLIGLSNLLTIQRKITDPGAQSSFKPRVVTTQSYDAKKLLNILKKRCELAFYPSKIDNGSIAKAAAFASRAGGDCRYGLALLDHAVDIVYEENEKRITERCIEKAQKVVEETYIYEEVNKLKYPHKLLLMAIVKGKIHKLNEIFNWCNDWSMSKLSEKRLSEYLHELEKYGFIYFEREGKGDRKGVLWYAKLSSNLDHVQIENCLSKSPDLEMFFHSSTQELK